MILYGGARSEISCGYGTSSAACSASFICVGMRNAYPPLVISASGAGSAAAGAFGAGAGVNVDRSRSRMMPTKWVTTPSEPSGTIVRSLTKSVRSARKLSRRTVIGRFATKASFTAWGGRGGAE